MTKSEDIKYNVEPADDTSPLPSMDVKKGASISIHFDVLPDESDKGHIQLIVDLKDLMSDVINYHFHDFKTRGYAMPKAALVDRLGAIRLRAIEGRYDN